MDRRLSRTPRECNRAGKLLAALDAKAKCRQLLYTAQALILCGLPYRPTPARTVVRESYTSRGRLRVTFHAAFNDVPLPYGKDAVLLTFLTTKAILSDGPTVSFATAREYLTLFNEDGGGRSYKLLAARWRRLAGLVISVERQGEATHQSRLQVVIAGATLPARATTPDGRIAPDRRRGSPADYTITLGADFWADLRAHAVPLLLPVMRAFANRPLAWHFVQYLQWRSYVALRAAAHGHIHPARITWHELRLMLGSTTTHDKQLRRELRTAIVDLKCLWPECNAGFDAFTLWIAAPTAGVTLVASREGRPERRTGLMRPSNLQPPFLKR